MFEFSVCVCAHHFCDVAACLPPIYTRRRHHIVAVVVPAPIIRKCIHSLGKYSAFGGGVEKNKKTMQEEERVEFSETTHTLRECLRIYCIDDARGV